MQMDEVLASVADKVKNFAVVYLVDKGAVPDFNAMYELYDPCTVMFFFRNKVRWRGGGFEVGVGCGWWAGWFWGGVLGSGDLGRKFWGGLGWGAKGLGRKFWGGWVVV